MKLRWIGVDYACAFIACSLKVASSREEVEKEQIKKINMYINKFKKKKRKKKRYKLHCTITVNGGTRRLDGAVFREIVFKFERDRYVTRTGDLRAVRKEYIDTNGSTRYMLRRTLLSRGNVYGGRKRGEYNL